MSNGIIRLNDGFTISNKLTKSTFLQAKASEAELLLENQPFSSYKLPTLYLFGIQLNLTLGFRGEQIREVHLYPIWEHTPKGWGQYNTDLEEVSKQKNDILLKQLVGEPPYNYAWGEISSTFDLKSGYSEIIIRYT